MATLLRIAVLGRKPTYCSIAAEAMLRPGIELDDSYRTISEVVKAVSEGKVTWGVVPLRNNSITGEVITDTEQAFKEHPGSTIIAKRFLPVRLALLARTNASLEGVETVISKAQALEQCAIWLDQHLPNAERIAVDSTSSGLHRVYGDTSVALVGNAALADRGLAVLAENVQDNPDNATEFAVIVQADGSIDLLKEYLTNEQTS